MSISREDSGTYTVQVWYRDWQGVRRKKTKRGFATRSAAKEFEASYRVTSKGAPSMKFSEFAILYEKNRKPQLKLNTWNMKKHIIKRKILPYFGDMRLDEITAADIAEWQTGLICYRDEKGKPYSKTYLRTVANQLSAMLNHAVKLYNLPSNPM